MRHALLRFLNEKLSVLAAMLFIRFEGVNHQDFSLMSLDTLGENQGNGAGAGEQ
jgi:hypothetical protein